MPIFSIIASLVWAFLRDRAELAEKVGEAVLSRPDYAQCRTKAQSPDLARVVKAWPDLSEPIRAAILAMIQSATGARR
jgi:hypothetical protein